MAEQLTDEQRLQLTILSYQDGDTHKIYKEGLTLKDYVDKFKEDELLQLLASDSSADRDLAKTVLSIQEEIRDNPNGTMAKLKVTDKDAIPLARSEGELANELPNAVGALMTYGDSVAALLMHISETLTEAADRFEITDRSLTYEE